MELTSKEKGNLTELQCLMSFYELGHKVSIPYGENCRYDFILDVNGTLLKIQVKTSHKDKEKESFTFKCRSVTGRGEVKHASYSKEEIDYFATYWDNKVYLVPVEECSSQKTLRLNKDTIRSNWNYAEDYLAEEVLKAL